MMQKDTHHKLFVTAQKQKVSGEEFEQYRPCTRNISFRSRKHDETLINQVVSKASHRLTSLQRSVQAQVTNVYAFLSATCMQKASQTRCLNAQRGVLVQKIEV
ncbi:MAG: hypothetical protein ACMXYD_00320 [Candidatus Woesearchaeota archaeon]